MKVVDKKEGGDAKVLSVVEGWLGRQTDNNSVSGCCLYSSSYTRIPVFNADAQLAVRPRSPRQEKKKIRRLQPVSEITVVLPVLLLD